MFTDDGENKDFPCANPIIGRYVYIQMVGIEGSLSLCEVFAFTTKGKWPSKSGPIDILIY